MRNFKYSLSLLLFILFNSAFAKDNYESFSYDVGQIMMVGFNGTEINKNSPIVKEIKEYHIGGIIIDNHKDKITNQVITNIKNPEQLRNLIKKLNYFAKKYHDAPLFIAINQEGGMINTLKPLQGFHSQNDPSEFELGKLHDKQTLYNTAFGRGTFLKSYGINVNLAPVADLLVNAENPGIAKLQRSFGPNENLVTEDLKTTIMAYRKAKIICTLKHFPGLGSAKFNTDYDFADITDSWLSKELIPYQRLIQQHQSCPIIMVSHAINTNIDKVPLSLSKKAINNLLIHQLHFTGLVITDDMDAVAIRKHFSTDAAIQNAILAGNDIILYGGTQGNDPDADAKMLFNTLQKLAAQSPNVKKRILNASKKIQLFKNQYRGYL